MLATKSIIVIFINRNLFYLKKYIIIRDIIAVPRVALRTTPRYPLDVY